MYLWGYNWSYVLLLSGNSCNLQDHLLKLFLKTDKHLVGLMEEFKANFNKCRTIKD